jgi:hypothetical protein
MMAFIVVSEDAIPFETWLFPFIAVPALPPAINRQMNAFEKW